MFTIAKVTDKGIVVDTNEIHNTAELHHVGNISSTKCVVCNKDFKAGDEAGLIQSGDSFDIAHRECPKDG